MKKTTLATILVGLIVVLYLVNRQLEKKEGFFAYKSIGVNENCSTKQVKFVHGNKAFCFDIGDYSNTSGLWSRKDPCKVSAPVGMKLQAYYNKDFSTPTWSVNPGATWNGKCWPWSIKVMKA